LLTDVRCRKAQPREKPFKLFDSGGLYLLVSPGGKRKPEGLKHWRLKYRVAGKEKLLALGVYPLVSIADARTARDEAKRLLAEGRDPATARRDDKRAALISAAATFEAIAREWVEQQRNRWTPDHAERVLDSLVTDVFPAIGFRPIAEITAPELLAVLRKIEARGALEVASRVYQRCGAVFRYAVATGRCERSPVGDLRGALKAPKREHRPALLAADLPEYLRALEAYDGQLQTKLALKLLALTFVRSGELRGAEWSEFDLEQAEWRIPAERMKMRAAHIVPLSRQALAVLAQLKPLTGQRRFLLPNQHKPDACMSENTMLYALYRMGYHSRATGHGFRATASTILNEKGWRADAIERQLAHAEKNKVRAAYHRSEYLPERRKMMQAWADYLDRLASGAKASSAKRSAKPSAAQSQLAD
jgi:integrase